MRRYEDEWRRRPAGSKNNRPPVTLAAAGAVVIGTLICRARRQRARPAPMAHPRRREPSISVRRSFASRPPRPIGPRIFHAAETRAKTGRANDASGLSLTSPGQLRRNALSERRTGKKFSISRELIIVNRHGRPGRRRRELALGGRGLWAIISHSNERLGGRDPPAPPLTALVAQTQIDSIIVRV